MLNHGLLFSSSGRAGLDYDNILILCAQVESSILSKVIIAFAFILMPITVEEFMATMDLYLLTGKVKPTDHLVLSVILEERPTQDSTVAFKLAKSITLGEYPRAVTLSSWRNLPEAEPTQDASSTNGKD